MKQRIQMKRGHSFAYQLCLQNKLSSHWEVLDLTNFVTRRRQSSQYFMIFMLLALEDSKSNYMHLWLIDISDFRLLITDPSKHHALHLASINKSCEANPLTLLNETGEVEKSNVKIFKTVSVSRTEAPQSEAALKFNGIDDLEAMELSRENKDSGSFLSSISIFGSKESKFKTSR